MWKNSGKISLYIGMLAGFVVTLQAFQGTFKTFWPGKLVRISKSSQSFLGQVVPLEQELFAIVTRISHGVSHQDQQHLLALLQLSRSWSRVDNMQGTDIDRFGQLVSWFKPVETTVIDLKTLQSAQPIIRSIAQIIAIEIAQVHIGTAQIDLQHVGQFLQQLQKSGWNSSVKSKVLQVFGIVQDVMHHFDGFSITEYDFMVLSQTALFMQLLSCLN